MSKFAVAVVLIALGVVGVQGWTLQRDIDALKLLKEEVQWRDPQWAGVVANWQGGGEWGKDDPCGLGWKGNWLGIECRDQEHLPKETPRVVTNIHLTDRGLSGPSPLAMVLLKDLKEIDFDGNRITGPLNPFLGCMENLEEVDYANNDLHGTIPTEWRFLNKLQELELETNSKLYGCVPQEMPPTTTICKKENGNAVCELMGVITFETKVSGICKEKPNIGKRCADYNMVRQFINNGMKYEEMYKSHGDSSGGQQPGYELHQG
ncbi:hypothetical protein BSKO_12279 [Bryopsis sp. KO-2023]|nr:hypothetical protein BSKO_12279 [Bryopsis sp. KO-2023]